MKIISDFTYALLKGVIIFLLALVLLSGIGVYLLNKKLNDTPQDYILPPPVNVIDTVHDTIIDVHPITRTIHDTVYIG